MSLNSLKEQFKQTIWDKEVSYEHLMNAVAIKKFLEEKFPNIIERELLEYDLNIKNVRLLKEPSTYKVPSPTSELFCDLEFVVTNWYQFIKQYPKMFLTHSKKAFRDLAKAEIKDGCPLSF